MQPVPPDRPGGAADPMAALAEAVPHMIWAADPDGQVVYLNGRCLAYTGLAPADLVGAGWHQVVHPDDLPRTLEAWAQSLRTGDLYEVEYRLRAADGAYRWHLGRAAPVRDDQGRVVRWVGTCTDIDGQKRAEAQQRTLANRLGERVKELTALHRIARLLHDDTLDISHLLQAVVALLPPAWQHPDVAAARIVFAGTEARTPNYAETPWRQLAPFVTADGRAGAVEVVYLAERPAAAEGPFLAEERALLESVAELLRLALDRRRADEANAWLAAVVDGSDDAICGETLDDIIVSWNPGSERMLGYTAAEVVGRHYALLLPPDRLGELGPLMERIRRGERVGAYDTVRVHKDGRRIDVSVTMSPVRDRPGRIIGASKTARDSTARQQAERELRQALGQLHALAAHLESVREEERARIAREIHDELGQALTGLKFDAAWLKAQVGKLLPADQAGPLLDRADGMAGAIDETIRTVRRIAADLRPSVLDDFGLVAGLEWLADEFQKRTGIRCTAVGEVEEPDRDRATALFRIAQEALTNVARHARATAVRIHVRSEAGYIILEVEDDGRGISPESAGRAGSFGILGMRERAALVGGDIMIEGRPGGGTRLTARVPLGPPADANRNPDGG